MINPPRQNLTGIQLQNLGTSLLNHGIKYRCNAQIVRGTICSIVLYDKTRQMCNMIIPVSYDKFTIHCRHWSIPCSPWWRHQMETFSALLALCAGNSRSTVKSPHKGQSHGALMFSLICAWTNSWVNNRESGDLGRQSAHSDVSVMPLQCNYTGAMFLVNLIYSNPCISNRSISCM